MSTDKSSFLHEGQCCRGGQHKCHLRRLNLYPPTHQCRCLCQLLGALMKPATVSIIHCPGHQRERDSVARGSRSGLQETATGNWDWTKGWPHLEYTTEKRPKLLKDNGTLEGKAIPPREQAKDSLCQMHRWTHLQDNKLIQAVKVYVINLRFLARETVEQCKVCQQVNAYAARSKQGIET